MNMITPELIEAARIWSMPDAEWLSVPFEVRRSATIRLFEFADSMGLDTSDLNYVALRVLYPKPSGPDSDSKLTKRYILFAGPWFYPEGGFHDFRGSFDTAELAEAHGKELIAGEKSYEGWWHVVDSTSCAIISEGEASVF